MTMLRIYGDRLINTLNLLGMQRLELQRQCGWRYVSFNFFHARLVSLSQDWQWSSVQAHLAVADDELVRVAPAIERYGDFSRFLGTPDDHTNAWQALWRSESTGHPLGSADWIAGLEIKTGKTLAPRKRGPKPKVPVAGVAKTHLAPKAC